MFGVWSHYHMVHDSSSSSIDEKASSGVLCKWLACSTRDHICSNINRSWVEFGNAVMFHVKTRNKEQTTSRNVTKARNLFSQSAFCSQPHLVVILQTSSRKRFYGQMHEPRQSNELRSDRFWGLPIKRSPLNKHFASHSSCAIGERQQRQSTSHKSFSNQSRSSSPSCVFAHHFLSPVATL